MDKSQESTMYMRMAHIVAEQSDDSKRQVGAIIVKDNNILAYGYNGTPSGYPTNECRDSEGNAIPEVVHAEINAIAKAALQGNSTEGATIYVTTAPCVECAKMIIQCGIRAVVYSEVYHNDMRGRRLLDEMHIPVIQVAV